MPLHLNRGVIQRRAAQKGAAGDLRRGCGRRSAVGVQPEFPASLMEICLSENQRIAPGLLEVVQDAAARHTHNVQALGFY